MPRKRDAASVWDRKAKRYDRQLTAGVPAYRDMLARSLPLLAPGDIVADVGCGSGQTACAIGPHVAAVHASDLSPRMLEIAASHARAQGLQNITFAHGDAAALAAADGIYDAVFCFALLHLVPRPEGVLQEFRRVLKPGGPLFLSAYCAGQSAASRVGNALMSLGGYLDHARWRADPFVQFVKDQGFRVEERRDYRMFPIPMTYVRAVPGQALPA